MPQNKHLRFCSVLEGVDGAGRYADTPEGDIDLGGMSFNPLQTTKMNNDIRNALKEETDWEFPPTSGIGVGDIYESCFQRDPWNTIEGPNKDNTQAPLQARETWGRPGVDRTNPGKNDMNIIDALNKIWSVISKNCEPTRPDPGSYDEIAWGLNGWGGRQQNVMKETLLPWIITYYIRSFWDPSSPTYMPNAEIGFTVNLQVKDRRWSYYGWQGRENVKPGKSVFYGSSFSFAPPAGGKNGYPTAYDLPDPYYFRGPFDESITVGPHQFTDSMGSKIAITRNDNANAAEKEQNLEALRLAAGCGVQPTGAVMYSEPTAAGRLGGLKNPHQLEKRW